LTVRFSGIITENGQLQILKEFTEHKTDKDGVSIEDKCKKIIRLQPYNDII
jgi:hypothetical protein